MKIGLRKLALGLVSIVMGLGVSSAFGEVQNISGTWKLSVEKSGYGNRPKPKSALLSIEHREPALKYSVIGFDTEGKPFRSAFAGAIDGKEYPTTGNRNVGKGAFMHPWSKVFGLQVMEIRWKPTQWLFRKTANR
jgi:hypothetical protein